MNCMFNDEVSSFAGSMSLNARSIMHAIFIKDNAHYSFVRTYLRECAKYTEANVIHRRLSNIEKSHENFKKQPFVGIAINKIVFGI